MITNNLHSVLEAEELCEGPQPPQLPREGLQEVVTQVERGQLLQGPDGGRDEGELVVPDIEGLQTYQSADPVSKFCQLIRVQFEGGEEGETAHFRRQGGYAVGGEGERS